MYGGSSPLARGLPPRPTSPDSTERIIPARAGFTSRPPPRGTPREDHPRSRGVYDRPVTGLVGDLRIIPARAGFTTPHRTERCAPWDHPRSRGVYPSATTSCGPTTGSSPLARGLLEGGDGLLEFARIIPARAGFTGAPGRRAPGCGDHPRSRGVYTETCASRISRPGSSPLARGLPDG